MALQSELCQPLKSAVDKGLDHADTTVTVSPTIAEGIAIGQPLRDREILAMVKKHNILVITAPEDKILEARAAMAKKGYYIEHTTAANFAAWDAYKKAFNPKGDVVITLCGAGIKSDH